MAALENPNLNNRVSFAGSEEQQIPVVDHRRGSINSEEKAKRKHQNVTCKYDRKVMRIRLDIEEWMDEQLRELYECEEDEDYPIEIDIDDLLQRSNAERQKEVESLLRDATQPSEEFISILLTRVLELQKKSNIMSSPGAAQSIDFQL